MDKQKLLEQLKQFIPYLADIEAEVEKIRQGTGFGEVSTVLKVKDRRVIGVEFIGAMNKLYVERK